MSDPATPDTASKVDAPADDATAPPPRALVPLWYFPALGLVFGAFSLALSLAPSIFGSVSAILMLIAIRLLEVAYRRRTGVMPPLSADGFGSWLSVAWLVVTFGLLVASFLLTMHQGQPWFAIAGSALIVLATIGYGWVVSDPEVAESEQESSDSQ